MTFYAFLGIIKQGLVYGIIALELYITFKVLNFPNLIIDGSLPSSTVAYSFRVSSDWNPFSAILPTMPTKFLTSTLTDFLTKILEILHLLTLIPTMTTLYSINIKIMGSYPNITLLGKTTAFDPLATLNIPSTPIFNLVFFLVATLIIVRLGWLISTKFGQSLLATNNNTHIITNLKVNTTFAVIIDVILSNALMALPRTFVAQNQCATDLSIDISTIMVTLASIVLGKTLLPNHRRVWLLILAIFLGSVIYRLAITLALVVKINNFSFTPNDLNLITASVVTLILNYAPIPSHCER